MGVLFGIVSPDYTGEADNVLVWGQEYRIWSRQHSGSAVFLLPEEPKSKLDLSLVWIANKGQDDSHTALPRITGIIEGALPKHKDKLVAGYVNPSTKHQQIAEIVNGKFSMKINEEGGELVIGSLSDEGGPAWIYKASVSGGELKFPRDADRVFSEEQAVPFSIHVRGSPETVKNVAVLAIFVAKKDVLPVHGIELSFGTQEKMLFDQNQTIQLNVNPGEYWLRIYGDEAVGSVLGEVPILVQKNLKGNEVTIDVGLE